MIGNLLMFVLILTAITGFCMGVRKQDTVFMAVMVFMIFFAVWCLKNGHRIGINPEPVHIAERSVRV